VGLTDFKNWTQNRLRISKPVISDKAETIFDSIIRSFHEGEKMITRMGKTQQVEK